MSVKENGVDSEICSTVSNQSFEEVVEEDDEIKDDNSPKTDCSIKKLDLSKVSDALNEDLSTTDKKVDQGVLEEVLGYFKNSSFLMPYLVNQFASLFNNFLIATTEL